MLSINHLDIRYGEKHLFKDVSVQVYEGNRIGLVGVNGAGKSTLLRIMGGVTASDDGVVNKAKTVTVGYLPQESTELLAGRTLYQEAQTAFSSLLIMQQELEGLNEQLGRLEPDSDQFRQMFDLYVVEASSNLVDWTPLATLLRTIDDPDPLLFQDSNAAGLGQRFYRIFPDHLLTAFPKPGGPSFS